MVSFYLMLYFLWIYIYCSLSLGFAIGLSRIIPFPNYTLFITDISYRCILWDILIWPVDLRVRREDDDGTVGVSLSSDLALTYRFARTKILTSFNTGLSALCDILATCSMCIFLASQKSVYKQCVHPSFDQRALYLKICYRTRTIISFLLFISINRGVLVAIAQLGFMTSYLAAPSKIYCYYFMLNTSSR